MKQKSKEYYQGRLNILNSRKKDNFKIRQKLEKELNKIS